MTVRRGTELKIPAMRSNMLPRESKARITVSTDSATRRGFEVARVSMMNRIRENPEYAHVICRCETVTEGEIRDAIRRDPKPRDIDGVKRRTRSGMGRCQGGFCKPFVMKLLAEENDCRMEEVTKNGKTSQMVLGKL